MPSSRSSSRYGQSGGSGTGEAEPMSGVGKKAPGNYPDHTKPVGHFTPMSSDMGARMSFQNMSGGRKTRGGRRSRFGGRKTHGGRRSRVGGRKTRGGRRSRIGGRRRGGRNTRVGGRRRGGFIEKAVVPFGLFFSHKHLQKKKAKK